MDPSDQSGSEQTGEDSRDGYTVAERTRLARDALAASVSSQAAPPPGGSKPMLLVAAVAGAMVLVAVLVYLIASGGDETQDAVEPEPAVAASTPAAVAPPAELELPPLPVGEPTPPILSRLALVPFRAPAGDAGLERLATQITGAIGDALWGIPNLRFEGPDALAAALSEGTSARDAAAAVDADAWLTGNLGRDAQGLTVSISLRDVANDRVLWIRTLQQPADDALATAADVAGQVTRFLDAVTNHPRPAPDSLSARRAWLDWLFARANGTPGASMDIHDRVLALDPGYADGRIEAIELYTQLALTEDDPSAWITRAEAAMEEAEDRDLDERPDFLRAAGLVQTYLLGDLDDGEPLLRAAGGTAHAQILLDSGLVDAAAIMLEYYGRRDPTSVTLLEWQALAHAMQGDPERALGDLDTALPISVEPTTTRLQAHRLRLLAFQGRSAEARALIERLQDAGPLAPATAETIADAQAWMALRAGDDATALARADALAGRGRRVAAALLRIEAGVDADGLLQQAVETPHPAERMVSHWLHLDPSWAEREDVRAYLDGIGFDADWTEEMCDRGEDLIEALGAGAGCP